MAPIYSKAITLIYLMHSVLAIIPTKSKIFDIFFEFGQEVNELIGPSKYMTFNQKDARLKSPKMWWNIL